MAGTESKSIEDLQLDIEAKICGFPLEKLETLAQFLKVEMSVEKPKGRLHVTRKIRQELDALVTEHENKADFLHEVSEFITQDEGEHVEVSVGISEKYEHAKKEYEELQGKFKAMMENQTKLLKEAEEKVNLAKQTSPVSVVNSPDVNALLKREFKISGTVGGDHQKDELSFVGLIRRIDSGLGKGYK